ncbi:hypothetical protein PTTG_01943 [Puccinia triticina 1-1 BBBD Race 1]|uniref:N-acetyltransferase domain-containing protein n=1 Tax=Puccinia triticina (isolate 1-1 / race 1 (BBBD)) TaxID=630390 RepID=A0A180GBX6_PUCT1|nr:hypothetical protein PTTG_01943 [Puccinia triticina 1-1 BBBD Race 1]
MRVNEQTAIVGPRVVLVPYRKEHVPQYHEWMSDQELRESTASEPLSLLEEYEMCERWALDQDKLTFIIFSRNSSLSIGSDPPEKHTTYSDYLGQMIGDVNLFISADESLEDSTSTPKETDGQAAPNKGELEIMIASKDHRKLGLATEALQLFLAYILLISRPLSPSQNPSQSSFPHISFFFVKISFSNTISQRLFEKLGFERTSTNKIFEEYEYRLKLSGSPVLSIDDDDDGQRNPQTDPPRQNTDQVNSNEQRDPENQVVRAYKAKWKAFCPIKMALIPCPLNDPSAASLS